MKSSHIPLFNNLFFIKIYVCVLPEILYTVYVQVPMETRGYWIYWNWSDRQL